MRHATLTMEQAATLFALQRLSKAAAHEAHDMKQLCPGTPGIAVMEAMAKRLDAETERLLAEFQSSIVRPTGLVRPA